MLNDSNADQTNGGAATTQDVLRHHLSCLAKRDLSGMMADYAPDSKFFTWMASNVVRPRFGKSSQDCSKSSQSRVCPLRCSGRRSRRHRLHYLEGQDSGQPLRFRE